MQVKNFAPTPAEQVLVKVRSTFHPASLDGSESAPQVADLPDVLIERIAPGEAISRQLQVYFPTAGRHVVQARLPADAVTADNQRWCVVDLPLGEPVTIVDGDPEGRAAYYLESIFQPGSDCQDRNPAGNPADQLPARRNAGRTGPSARDLPAECPPARGPRAGEPAAVRP